MRPSSVALAVILCWAIVLLGALVCHATSFDSKTKSGTPVPANEANQLLGALDTNKDGFVSDDEIRGELKKRGRSPEEIEGFIRHLHELEKRDSQLVPQEGSKNAGSESIDL